MNICHIAFTFLVISLALPGSGPTRAKTYDSLPLSFEANQGQAARDVMYLSRGQGYTLFLTGTEAVLRLAAEKPRSGAVVRMKLEGAAAKPRVEGLGPLPGRSHYFIGADPAGWHTNIPNFARIRYRDVYPGVDLVYYGNQRRLEYDFVVAPGADFHVVQLAFEGSIGRLSLDPAGNLFVRAAAGRELCLHKPVIYQQAGDTRRTVQGRYVLKGNRRVALKIAAYDTTRPLIIDPVLTYSTYLGAGYLDGANAIAADGAGNVYVTGWTSSTSFPVTAAAAQPASGGMVDAFVTKINPGGTAILYSTYFGGSADDYGRGIALDPAGNIYVTGSTSSNNFPAKNSLQPFGGGVDGFVVKLNPTGSLNYSTLLGGSGNDEARGVAADSAGNVYVAGVTSSANFPITPGAFQTTLAGSSDAFVTKLNPDGTGKAYSTYLGGSNLDEANGIAVDRSGNAWVTGSTWSSNFPVMNSLQTLAGSTDAFVSKLNANGTGLLFSTYLGGHSIDRGLAIALDPGGNAYVTGNTGSTDFPTTPGVLQSSKPGLFPDEDAFVTKYNAAGTRVVYSTYLGGTGDDSGFGIAADTMGRAYVTGQTASGNFPFTSTVWDFGGAADAFITALNLAGSAAVYSTPLGGNANEAGRGVALGPSGQAYVAGSTNSRNFPVRPSPGAVQPASAGGIQDGFVAAVTENLRFVPVTPCRVADTRTSTGKAGFTGSRDFPVVGLCGVPDGARAYSFNVSAIPRGPSLGFLAIWPAGQVQPAVSTLNSFDGRVKADAALVPAGLDGAVSVFVSDASDVFLDISGYFVPANLAPGALAYYPVAPCRIMDTRGPTGKAGFIGTRTIPMLGVCGLPAGAQAYAVNFTVIPRTSSFSFLSAWPTGNSQPVVSTLNAYTGAVTANAAIVPAGAGGSINVYHTDNADLLVDVNGYFAAPGTGGLSFYPWQPCRAVDTRPGTGKVGFDGTRDFSMPASACPLPVANAYSLNATGLPRPQLDFLSLWATGGTQPPVSTLNSFDGSVVSNAAIVPANAAGSITAYHTQKADLLLDVNGYFVP